MGNLKNEKLLIFIVAYNAEHHIENVLNRIPQAVMDCYDYEVLIIDDHSKDKTFEKTRDYIKTNQSLNIKILYNPINQRYGGNQKLGYRYAIDNGFDYVVLLHGDGQYAPECLMEMVEPLRNGENDFVMGSRMINKSDALKGGMPYYKFLGNIILTRTQNFLLKSDLKEFHSGYRSYNVHSLKKIPFELNSNDYNFDTQIIIQSLLAKFKIKEIPIPTYYGDEICNVDGIKYARQIIGDTINSRLHQLNIFYKKEYDIKTDEPHYDIKLGYMSSHTMAIDTIAPNSSVLDIGCGTGLVAKELRKKSCNIIGLDMNDEFDNTIFDKFYSQDIEQFDFSKIDAKVSDILMLDIIEHLKSPEDILDKIRDFSGLNMPRLIITTPNIAFFIIRLQLLLGKFNYGKKGILDLTHTRLFTFKTMRKIVKQHGYQIIKVKGVPAPFPKAIGKNWLSMSMLTINQWLIYLSKSMFSYQIYMEVRPTPTVGNLLVHTQSTTDRRIQSES